jgi:hypothetical protein
MERDLIERIIEGAYPVAATIEPDCTEAHRV